MSIITTTPGTLAATAERTTASVERRLAGLSAIAFAALVIIGNVLLGATPARDASASEVSEYVSSHRTALVVSVALYAVASMCMLCFTSAFQARLRQACRPQDM